jgi:hypothetical protein
MIQSINVCCFCPAMLTGSTSVTNPIHIPSILWIYLHNNHQHTIIIIGIVTTAIAIPVTRIVAWEIFLWFTSHICLGLLCGTYYSCSMIFLYGCPSLSTSKAQQIQGGQVL